MGEWIKLKAADGIELRGYEAKPAGEAKGGVVVVQEIFGVNASIRGVADAFAEQGYVAIAPAIFDRFEKDVELGYQGEDMKKAFELYGKLSPEKALLDIAAAFAELKKKQEKVAVMGFCYGGLMSWLSATRGTAEGMTPACTVGYYAGGVGNVAHEKPACPVMLHFGEADSHIGKDQVEAVQTAHPEVEVHTYPGAQHGFANAYREEYNEEQAKVAWGRTLGFLKKHLG